MSLDANRPKHEQRFVFDEVPELYARARPTYPAALIEDLIRAATLQPGGASSQVGRRPMHRCFRDQVTACFVSSPEHALLRWPGGFDLRTLACSARNV